GQIGFVLYQNDKFFRSRAHRGNLVSTRRVISGNIRGGMLNVVELLFGQQVVPNFNLHDYSCVFWNYSTTDWSTNGCSKGKDPFGYLKCQCNHTTNFAVLMTFRQNYTYSKPLEVISYVGCGLSIAGLSLTILYQIVTRKTRKTTPTVLLVSVCMSMLMFNIVFIAGISNTNQETQIRTNSTENVLPNSDIYIEPDKGPCTAVAALLHFFLLASFTWALLYAVQVYMILVNVFSQPPQHFGLITIAVGWGFPAVVVAITLAVLYRVENPLDYRQEEFCWLAALDREGKFDFKKPMLWAFLLPVALILIFNMVLLVRVTLELCRSNPNLNSTKKNSYLKKFLSSLSVAVVLGVSWVLGYLLLIDHDQSSVVFSYIFCILNSTQGLQIFILFTVRTSLFKKKVSEIINSTSGPEIYLRSKTFKLMSFKRHNHKETYRPTEEFLTSRSSFSSS
ncbi:AGRG7 protein, partial [Amia calva]|nr:AGRG7 protein [Amia calva]